MSVKILGQEHIDYIQYVELREVFAHVDDNGEPTDWLDDMACEDPTPHPYTCTKCGEDFTDWDEVTQHLRKVKI